MLTKLNMHYAFSFTAKKHNTRTIIPINLSFLCRFFSNLTEDILGEITANKLPKGNHEPVFHLKALHLCLGNGTGRFNHVHI